MTGAAPGPLRRVPGPVVRHADLVSWDVYAVRAPGARRLEDVAAGRPPGLVGVADEVLEVVREAAPHVDASDPTWLVLEGQDHSLELALGKGVQVHDLTFYVRGGQGSVALVLDVCRRLGVTPFDTETGEKLTAASTPALPEPPAEDEDERPKRRWWRPGGGG